VQPIYIPEATQSISLDGVCDQSEYSDASELLFSDYGISGTVYLKHDSTNLYVCMKGKGSSDMLNNRFASVYLDPENDSGSFADKADYALRVEIITGTLSSAVGTGSGNYTPAEITGWSAAANFDEKYSTDSAEYKIPLTLAGGRCDANFRIAVYHHWLYGTGNDYGWPSNHWYDSPQTWQLAALVNSPCAKGTIAYVYKNDLATAGDFESLLIANGFTVQLIPLTSVLTTDFSVFDLLIVAADTGNLDVWGTTAGQSSQIVAGGKSILGLGEGGYAFFGKLGQRIGWPWGWHGWNNLVIAADSLLSYYHIPTDFIDLLPGPFPIYSEPVGEVGIYLASPITDVLPIGWEPPQLQTPDHASLVFEGCYQLWGFNSGPEKMNTDGSSLFINAVVFALNQQCTPPPPPPPDCLTITKSASPSTTVTPGEVISYTLAYTVSSNQACRPLQTTLIDSIPSGTTYVPNSASDGISPSIEGLLIWNLGSLDPGSSGSKDFNVTVLDTSCNQQANILNEAQIYSSLGVAKSNPVEHALNCPPVTFPNDEPSYAEEEVRVYPYPMIPGHPSEISARLHNRLASAQTVTVTFQLSPDKFGIGLTYNAIPALGNPRVVTIPAGGTAEVRIFWAPVVPGHYCIQVKVEGVGFAPIYTQRNLDVAENLQPGVEDTLTFAVGNPTDDYVDILLVVDNTCPGWTARIDPAMFSSVAPGEVRTATLYVTPPSGGSPLGTACHIDVQGWVGSHLIGGIRKLDLPAVQLPQAEPPWDESEISVTPDPPVVGLPAKFCVELQNPLPEEREVELVYYVADFGAGVPFTQIVKTWVTIPANSDNRYCLDWTPSAGGTLHRCLQIRLIQDGFLDQVSQRNIDLIPGKPGVGSVVSFMVRNSEDYTRTLELGTDLVGIWGLVPAFNPLVPPVIDPYETISFTMELTIPIGLRAADGVSAPPNYSFGDSQQVNVGVYMDDNLIGGFTVEYVAYKIYLPVVLR
jgi:uncharacterized repeat protein (TIGR01451 family)